MQYGLLVKSQELMQWNGHLKGVLRPAFTSWRNGPSTADPADPRGFDDLDVLFLGVDVGLLELDVRVALVGGHEPRAHLHSRRAHLRYLKMSAPPRLRLRR
jgi:hypothetical protein